MENKIVNGKTVDSNGILVDAVGNPVKDNLDEAIVVGTDSGLGSISGVEEFSSRSLGQIAVFNITCDGNGAGSALHGLLHKPFAVTAIPLSGAAETPTISLTQTTKPGDTVTIAGGSAAGVYVVTCYG